jgi:hypothetical protein
MAAETLRPAQRSRREKVCDWMASLLSFAAVLAANFLWPEAGYWSLAAAVLIPLPIMLLFGWLASSERKARLARDAERGLIECAIRRPDSLPGSLQGRWKPGYAEVHRGVLRFQALYVGVDEPAGPISSYTNISPPQAVPVPEKRRADVKRKWRMVAMRTDQGTLELAASEAALRLLDSRRVDPR